MSSTKKTTNYQLSQYIGTDKPTYLGDYNSDMSKIDAAIKKAADAASTAASTAGSAQSKAEQASQDVESMNENVSDLSGDVVELQGTVQNISGQVGTASSVAQSALTTANQANTNANNALQRLDKMGWTASQQVNNLMSGMSHYSSNPIQVSYNEGLGLLNMFGGAIASGGVNITTSSVLFQLPSSVPRPSTQKTIPFSGFYYRSGGEDMRAISMVVDTAGNVRSQYALNGVTDIGFNSMIRISDWL